MKILKLLILLSLPLIANAQKTYTLEDSLRGTINENRSWWDVLRYDIEVTPDFEKKEISGKTDIAFQTFYKTGEFIQLDFQQPLIIDSIILWNTNSCDGLKYHINNKKGNSTKANFIQRKNICLITIPDTNSNYFKISAYYHGVPREAIQPPWDGGWIFKKDKLGRPWMSVAVQGIGASAWYPCKDHQSDEPDLGASLTVIVPDTLVAVANGRLTEELKIQNSKFKSYKWEIKSSINNYCIVPYIGKYVNWSDTLKGEKGKLDIDYYCLDYNVEKAKKQFPQAKTTLRALEHWFGAYPFYEDGYKLVEAPHLGMEHQSAVAYGNGFQNGYYGKDLSGSGWGNKWDFIIVHETGHEWFGNNITTKDIADMWVHESFTSYSEDLYTEYLFGKKAGNEYTIGKRDLIENKYPMISDYGVNAEAPDTDIYYKGENLIATIRHIMNDDKKFRMMLRAMNKKFYHQTVTTTQIEQFIITYTGIDFTKTFDQYLRTTQIPTLHITKNTSKNTVNYKWENCITGFDMPIVLKTATSTKKILPNTYYKTTTVNKELLNWITEENLTDLYYIKASIKLSK